MGRNELADHFNAVAQQLVGRFHKPFVNAIRVLNEGVVADAGPFVFFVNIGAPVHVFRLLVYWLARMFFPASVAVSSMRLFLVASVLADPIHSKIPLFTDGGKALK